MLLKDGRQIDPIGRRFRRIVQCREQHVLLQAAGVGFDALQDARMKRMEKIAVAQEKADHFRALLENSAGLRIGAKSETADGIQNARARFPAYLRAGIQHARNRSDAYACSAGYLANGRFCWNRFHCNWGSRRLRASSSVRGGNVLEPLPCAKLSTP